MDVLQHLLLGFHTALTPINLFYALAGAFVGTIVGVLPGIGPRGSMAILLSFTLNKVWSFCRWPWDCLVSPR